MTKGKQPVRCAIYTRKSSDEGLEQSFNSLDAQRAAGEAYVTSQASEGWTIIPTLYDDGGYSGGTMERPGLQALLNDIEGNRIDVVVVYKIDRLTRSLTDFSRIIETFDKAGTSFVSVTQSFNTKDSMGRLMLNVLLSFAQFEREVTGERIRDKIAASKAKGMWMGGNVPLGYDVPAAGTRTLQINKDEAETVRGIFSRYLELGSVHALQRDLTERKIFSKLRIYSTGRVSGGTPFSRGALFHLLRNRVYLGQIVHKDQVFEGEHDGIVDPELFERVQRKLDRNARRHSFAAEHRVAKAPLTGKLFDANSELMSPSFSRGRSNRVYRYYVSSSLQQGSSKCDDAIVQRLPATAIETIVSDTAARWLPHHEAPLDLIRAVRIADDGLVFEFAAKLADGVSRYLRGSELIIHSSAKVCCIKMPISLPLRGGRRLIIAKGKPDIRPDQTLIAALRRAHSLLGRDRKGMPLLETSPPAAYDRNLVRLAFLAPDIQRDIISGRQPASLNLQQLIKMDIPICWNEQRKALNWPSAQLTCSAE
ncbi:recombinase family protein [Erythrobacter sp. F6033]|uniref:recombinase family protein n=1 Tax=Erythrobacter sp. F6033 TaxID=2926401 RepID=UPI001FF40E88|nr:recombinase family protein [Erythrobacter sp. F6033]MCK0127511.1 recombinase family protein [Erythrobacter sp. F6033]